MYTPPFLSARSLPVPTGRIATGFALAALLTGVLAAQPTTPAPSTEVISLDRFEVTGEKLGRTAQETQTSVAAYTGDELAQSTDTTLADVFQRTANAYTNAEGFSLRGISNTGVTFTEGSDMSTVLIDGSVVDSQMLTYGGLSIWDLDQIEILRGPQSTSQGRNSLAGAVVGRTKNPTFVWDSKFRVTYAELNTTQMAAAFGGPVVPDLLAFRFTIDRHESDGPATNVTRNEDDWDRTDTTTYRGKLLFQPTRWNGFSALLTYAHTDSQDGERAYAYGNTREDLYKREAFENTRNDFESRSRLASLEVNQTFANGWLLSSTTAWSDLKSRSAYDSDRTPDEDLVYGFGYDNYTKSQEVRLLAKGESWKLLSGVYFAKVRRSYAADGPFYYVVPSPLDAVFGLASPARALLNVHQFSQVDTRNTAVFFNGDWKPADRWTLTAGLRLDREKLDRESVQDVQLLRGFPGAVALLSVPSLGIPAGAPADVVIQGIASGASAAANGDDEFETVLPSAGLTYNWTPDISTAFTYTRGYRSGGVSFNQKQAKIVAYDPEYTANYELSFRSQWLNKKVTLNANAFYVDWTDQQVAVQLSSDVYDRQVENAGKSTYYGLEIETREQLNAQWGFYQTIGLTRTKFDEFLTSTADYTGNEFARSPHWTLGAGVTYRQTTGWFGNAGVTYIKQVFGDADNDPAFNLDQRLIVNAKIGYNTHRWSAYLYGTNLLDDEYMETFWQESPGRYSGTPGDPRIVGVGLEARF